MDLTSKKIAVVGAGIGGLTAARAFALRGAQVTVLEQAVAIREVGAGLQVSPNGVAVLRGLGLDGALQNTGAVAARAVCLCNADGAEVLRLDLDRFAPGQSHYCVHRADLIDVLARGARDAGAHIRLLQKVTEADPGMAPEVELAQGAFLKADLVIGADGLHSAIRPALNPGETPFFTGQVAWRAVVDNDPADMAEVRLFMGPGRHLVTYPLRGGTLRNIVAVEETGDWTEESWSLVGDPDQLRHAFSGFGGEVGALLKRVDTVHRWGLFRHRVAKNWTGQGVALLGDAAHPTLPFMAQGACLALEDAWELGAAIAGAENMTAGLAAYQSARRPRASRIVAAASRNAWKYHLRQPALRGAAHLALRVGGRVAPAAMVRQFDWIYGYDATGGQTLV